MIEDQKYFIEDQLLILNKQFNCDMSIEFLNDVCYVCTQNRDVFNLMQMRLINFQTKERVRLNYKLKLEMLDDN